MTYEYYFWYFSCLYCLIVAVMGDGI